MPRRKTYNYLLLLFIVFSGLAGTPTDDVLSKKERKFAAEHMKSTKAELLDAVKGLSTEQLTYKVSADKWSVQECVYHIAISEKTLWAMLEASMKDGPQIVTKRGVETAVLIPVQEWRRLWSSGCGTREADQALASVERLGRKS